VWTFGKKDEYKQRVTSALQENDQEETNDGICLLTCLTGHTGNIHTVAFSKADMLVSQNNIL